MICETKITAGANQMIEIIEWYYSRFSYRRITTAAKDLKWRNTYHTLNKSNINSVRIASLTGPFPGHSIDHKLRFLFKNLEDKTLFDLTWK